MDILEWIKQNHKLDEGSVDGEKVVEDMKELVFAFTVASRLLMIAKKELGDLYCLIYSEPVISITTSKTTQENER